MNVDVFTSLFLGRVVVFAPFTGLSLDGHIMLNSGEVRHNWLDVSRYFEFSFSAFYVPKIYNWVFTCLRCFFRSAFFVIYVFFIRHFYALFFFIRDFTFCPKSYLLHSVHLRSVFLRSAFYAFGIFAFSIFTYLRSVILLSIFLHSVSENTIMFLLE